MSTGYFGLPGSQRAEDVTKVHVVDKRLRPICGAKIRPRMAYTFKGPGIEDCLDCETCRMIVQRRKNAPTTRQSI